MRLKELRNIVDQELLSLENPEKRISAANHLYGVSLAASLLAKKRGLDYELVAMAAMLHDLYAYKSSSYKDHAHKGAQLAKEILEQLHITSEEENEIICSAIYHHDDKEIIDGPIDECLKDADVIHHCFNDLGKEVKEKEKVRFASICEELGLKG